MERRRAPSASARRSTPIGLAYPSGFTPFGDGVAFAARDAGGTERLWLLDAAGTVRRLGIAAP